jgi:hypothetical protein
MEMGSATHSKWSVVRSQELAITMPQQQIRALAFSQNRDTTVPEIAFPIPMETEFAMSLKSLVAQIIWPAITRTLQLTKMEVVPMLHQDMIAMVIAFWILMAMGFATDLKLWGVLILRHATSARVQQILVLVFIPIVATIAMGIV